MARAHSSCEVWEQDFLRLELPRARFDGVFANASPTSGGRCSSTHSRRRTRFPFAHHDPSPCLMPPDWSAGYTSIFALQQKEARAAA